MKRASIAAVALLALTLTGCAGTAEPAADEVQESVSETPAAPATVEPTAEETPTPEEWFLQSGVVSQIDLPDDDKLSAAHYACEQVEAGNLEVVAVEGVDPGLNTVFVADSVTVFCPEHEEAFSAYRATLN